MQTCKKNSLFCKKLLVVCLCAVVQISTGLAQDEYNVSEILRQTSSSRASDLESFTADPDEIPLLRNMKSLTDEVLRNPPVDDWLIWRRTYDNHGHSPLNQINRDNVGNLGLAWRVNVTAGTNMPTPLVNDGVMYLYSAGDVVQAMDARNGELLWRYRHQGEQVTSQKFGIALYGDKMVVPTSDRHLVALDARTGAVLWDHAIDSRGRTGYRLRSAPLIADGQVIQGVVGGRVPGGGFIVAVDLETGEETWRFNTVARPGEPGGNTWNNIDLEERQGGSVWNTGSYDPELNLVYFGTAPTYHTGPLLPDLGIEGVNNDALYTNATLALRPATGELVWYFQHLANDQFDHDWVFERSIVELQINGEDRKVIVTAGKLGFFDAIDAATGEYLFSVDPGLQNVIADVDPETGRKVINPKVVPNAETGSLVCPFYQGSRNWPATSYSESAAKLFVPMWEFCMDVGTTNSGGPLSSGITLDPVPNPDSDGNFGRLQAIDLQTQTLAWDHRELAPATTATLSTNGGVVFVGFLDRKFKAFNDQNGEVLWETEVDSVPASFPITYQVDGKQYVALVVGQTNMNTGILLGVMNKYAGLNDPGSGDAVLLVYTLD